MIVKDYKAWVKTASIDNLLDALVSLYEENQEIKEDFEVYEESGAEMEENYRLVYTEIKQRAGGR